MRISGSLFCSAHKRDCHTRQVATPIERILVNARDTVRDRDASQTLAFSKRTIADARDAIGYRDAGPTLASIECILTNARDAGRNRDAGQAGAIIERIISNACDTVGDRDAGQAGAIIESTIVYIAACDGNRFQRGRDIVSYIGGTSVRLFDATATCIRTRAKDIAKQSGRTCTRSICATTHERKCHTFKGRTAAKRTSTNTDNTIRDGDVGQSGTIIESLIANYFGIVMNSTGCYIRTRCRDQHHVWILATTQIDCIIICSVGQVGTIFKRTSINARDAVGNRDARQAIAIIERITADACDALRKRDTCQVITVIKCTIAHIAACDGNRFQRGRDIVSFIGGTTIILVDATATCIRIIAKDIAEQGGRTCARSGCATTHERKCHTFKGGTAAKHRRSDARDALRKSDTRQVGTVIKRAIAYIAACDGN